MADDRTRQDGIDAWRELKRANGELMALHVRMGSRIDLCDGDAAAETAEELIAGHAVFRAAYRKWLYHGRPVPASELPFCAGTPVQDSMSI